jgi:RHS repeat-associated protein
MFSLSPRRFHSLLVLPAFLSVFLHAATKPADNQPPVANSDHYTVHGTFGTPLDSPPYGVLKNDSDPDGDPLTCVFTRVDTSLGTAFVFANGRATFEAANGQTGSVTIPYSVCDNHGACSSSTITFDVVNQPPVAGADEYTVHGEFVTPNEVPLTGVLKNDTDPEGDSLSCVEKRVDTAIGTAIIFANGKAQFEESKNGQTGDVSTAYTVCDNLGACSEGSVTFHVVNQAPVAADDFYVVRGSEFDTPIETPNGVLKNDSDPEGDAIHTSFARADFAQGVGFVFDNGKASFGRSNNALTFAGALSMQYTLCDSLGACSQGTVTFWLIGDGQDDGATSCNANIGGPINVTNGNMYFQQSDYSLPAVGPAINVTRTFNSDSQRTGIFGRGWSTAYDESITVHDNNLMHFSQPDGRAIYFGRPVGSSGGFAPLQGDFHGSLAQSGGGFTLTMKDGSVHQFNLAGKLASMSDRVGNQTTLGYDGSGKLISITDPFGRVLTVTPNTNGQVLSISDSMGTIASYTYGSGNELLSVTYADNSGFSYGYDGNYRLTSATDALGNIVESHTYDSQGRALTSEKQGGVDHYSLSYVSDTETDVTDGLSRVTKYTLDKSKGRNVVTRVEGLCSCGGGGGSQVQTWTYDNQLNVTSKTDALNHTTSYTYDGNGNRLTATDAVGTVTYTYNGFGEVLTLTDQLNGVTTNTYEAQGNLLSSTDARGKTTSFSNDSRGLLLTVTDARGKVASFAYDSSGNLITKTNALNHQTRFAYDARSRLTSTTNALGNVTALAYDVVDRLKQVTQADGTTISYEYDLAGRRTAMTDAKGSRSTYGYDGANRLTSEIDALNQSTSYSYDSMSNLTTSTDTLGRTTNFDYDDFSRLAKVTYPPATTSATRLFETIEYDADGNVTKRIDTAGRATQYQYDGVNRLISVTDPALQVTQYEYNARSEMTALVDALSQRYRFNYNSVGQLTHVRRGPTVMSFTYDAVGNRKTRTDYNGAPTDYTYDALNRLKTISYPDTTTVSYTYDKLSRLQTATNENGMIDFDYNKMNRLTRATDVFGQTVEYNYDDNGNRTRFSLNSAIVATYRYDVLNRPTKILDAASAAFTFDYDPADRLTQKKAPNNVKTSYQYDDLDRLTRLSDTKGAATLRDRQYQYNAASQITQIAEPSITRSYGYDPTDRLTSASYTNPLQPNENYAYDAVGNRTSSQLSAGYGYQPFNRLTNTSTASYSYDANGNLISKTEASGTTQYNWDFESRLKQVTLPNGATVIYKYDALGRRIQRARIGGISTNFIYDGQDVVKDSNSDGSTVDYLNGPGIDNKLRLTDSRLAATGPLYFLQDHLGSTTALTNSQGVAVSQISYDSFGNPTSSANLTRYTYTGREFDSDTGLYYYRARWYDPKVGRFISEDPIGFGGGDVNIYAYAANNPANQSDPTGQWSPPAHNFIIDAAFQKCLSGPQLQKLKDASAYVDRPVGQLEANAYQHGMRGGPNQSEADARRAAADFINGHELRARALAPNGCKDGYQNIPPNALWEIGQALHTIMDETSPAHEGFQIWNGPPYPTMIGPLDAINYAEWYRNVLAPHEAKETLDKLKGDPMRLEMVKRMVRDEFAKAFGDCGCCAD